MRTECEIKASPVELNDRIKAPTSSNVRTEMRRRLPDPMRAIGDAPGPQ